MAGWIYCWQRHDSTSTTAIRSTLFVNRGADRLPTSARHPGLKAFASESHSAKFEGLRCFPFSDEAAKPFLDQRPHRGVFPTGEEFGLLK
jgi:hypothetical protein